MQASEKNEKVPETIVAAMRQTNELFAAEVVAKGDVTVLDRIYTAAARILPPGAPMIAGREQIKSFWKQAVAAMGVQSAKLSSDYIEAAGEAVIEIGHADLGMMNGKSVSVKYVVQWKQEGGSWKWNIDIWNTNE
jgi:ketosteroid isomerase-like protein